MKIIEVERADFIIHETPADEMTVSEGCVEIKFYDDEDRKLKITFRGYLDMRQTKIDCFEYRDQLYEHSGAHSLEEVEDSNWIKAVEKNLTENKKREEWSWMGMLHHYIMVFHDSVFEIIAYENFEIEDTGERSQWITSQNQ